MPDRSPRAPAAAPDRRRVLVIEDDPDIAEAITYQLERAGISVKVARTGEEGLEGVPDDGDGIDLEAADAAAGEALAATADEG